MMFLYAHLPPRPRVAPFTRRRSHPSRPRPLVFDSLRATLLDGGGASPPSRPSVRPSDAAGAGVGGAGLNQARSIARIQLDFLD